VTKKARSAFLSTADRDEKIATRKSEVANRCNRFLACLHFIHALWKKAVLEQPCLPGQIGQCHQSGTPTGPSAFPISGTDFSCEDVPMESRDKLAGHPIHPMLIAFPLGLLATAVILDVIAFTSGNHEWSS